MELQLDDYQEIEDKNLIIDHSNYWRFLGLSREPFITFKDKDLFTPEYNDQFELALQYIQQKIPLIVITYDEKELQPALSAHFSHRLENKTLVMEASPYFDPIELLFFLAKECNMPLEHHEKDFDFQFKSLHLDLMHQQKIINIVIEKAHNLPIKTLEFIINSLSKMEEGASQFSFILLGDDSLDITLGQWIGENYSSFMQVIPLKPFDLFRIKNYLIHCLKIAGFKDEFPFTEKDLSQLYQMSEGKIEAVNQFARDMIIKKYFGNHNKIKLFLKTHRLSFITALMVLITFFFYFYNITHEKNENFQAEISHMTYLPGPSSLTIDSSKDSLNKNISSRKFNAFVRSLISEGREVFWINQITALSEKGYNEFQSLIQNSYVQSFKKADSPEIKESVNAQAVTDSAPELEKTLFPSSLLTGNEEITGQHDRELEALEEEIDNDMQDLGETLLHQAQEKSTAFSEKEAEAEKENPHETDNLVFLPEERLLAKNKNHYTIQLMNARYKHSLLKILEQYTFRNPMYTLILRNGERGFLLLDGEYASLKEAQEAVKDYPAGIKNQKPWIRTFASIQMEFGSRKMG